MQELCLILNKRMRLFTRGSGHITQIHAKIGNFCNMVRTYERFSRRYLFSEQGLLVTTVSFYLLCNRLPYFIFFCIFWLFYLRYIMGRWNGAYLFLQFNLGHMKGRRFTSEASVTTIGGRLKEIAISVCRHHGTLENHMVRARTCSAFRRHFFQGHIGLKGVESGT